MEQVGDDNTSAFRVLINKPSEEGIHPHNFKIDNCEKGAKKNVHLQIPHIFLFSYYYSEI